MTVTFTAEEALQQLETLLPPEALKPATRLVFLRAWEGEGYSTIATTIGYDETYVKRLAAVLWRTLSKVCQVKITKKNARLLLPGIFEKQQAASVSKRTPASPVYDWGAAPALDEFYGRTTELAQLKRWVSGDEQLSVNSEQLPVATSQNDSPFTKGGRGDDNPSPLNDSLLLKKGRGDQARLIALLGMGGIGKTTLSVKLAQDFQNQFDVVIWRSLRNAPPLNTLLTDLTVTLAGQPTLAGSVPELLNTLRGRRCFIVLDNLETILQAGKTGFYRSGYEDYGDLLRSIGEAKHQSCLILTSREKPPEIAALEGQSCVQALMLSGSPEAAQGILKAKAIRGTADQQTQLANLYGNSPLALKIVATSIQDLFQGEIAAFLAQETTVFNGIRRLLDEQFARLNPLEIQIMTWLAINRDWTAPEQLQRDIVPPVARSRILESLESLAWRSLIETAPAAPDATVGRYTQQPVVMEYVTDNLIAQIYEELITLEGDRFSRYPLTQTNVSEALRQSQVRLIIGPLVALLRNTFSSPRLLAKQLQKVLTRLRDNPQARYGAGNLIDIYAMLGIDLT
ncbi:MAG: hypothetical protein F6J87_28260, partial [Spirulina sp. SIO3F2]|nr:hypothetical protein [Spirulina sp. SIO3F2]